MDAKHKNLYFKDFVMLYTYAHTCSKKDETIKPMKIHVLNKISVNNIHVHDFKFIKVQ